MKPITVLQDILDLEALEENRFRGKSKDIGSPTVFGGQVLSQALVAAYQSVPEDRYVHSLHGYFILPGDIQAPIDYEVDQIRDGRSFTTRRVVAWQHGRAIFIMAASFQRAEEGLEHQVEMLNVPPPESLRSFADMVLEYAEKLPFTPDWLVGKDRPIEFRPVEDINLLNPGKRPPFRHVWFRSNGKLPEDKRLHSAVLAYASDFNLLMSALLPHNVSLFQAGSIQMASIDHALWFHRDFHADEWLLYAIDSPSASNARGFARGSIFSRDGRLVASVTQEGLIRVRK